MLQPMAHSKVKALSRVPLFAKLSGSELAHVASNADEVDVPAGKKLTTQGRPAESFYVLLDGEAVVEIDGEPRRTLKPGDFFGEISMLDRGPATATVKTKQDSKLLVMSHSQFRDTIKSSEGLLVKVLLAMGERLRADLEKAERKVRKLADR
jgi:CRP-like cAMP-binding protein